MADEKNNDWLSQVFGGLGSLGGGLFNKFGSQGKNPADVANSYISQIPGASQKYYSPYQQAGQGSLEDLQNQYKSLLGGDVQNKLGENYKQSPGYQFKLNQALAGGNNAFAAGGQLGLPQNQQYDMQLANDIASQDYNDYIKNQMGLYGLGLGGEEGLNKQGFEANKGYADLLGNVLSQQGYYGFEGQAGKNKANAQNNSDIWSGLGMLGGGIFGGPVGSALGGWLGKKLGGG